MAQQQPKKAEELKQQQEQQGIKVQIEDVMQNLLTVSSEKDYTIAILRTQVQNLQDQLNAKE